ncbi:hypothetical protein PALB_13240 [Pseudoalteromonas luteoviolacea B = ATCC 29581]|nr:hypothetical protein PALB_13240 [Pseudoalteromonas luteoviolacea B = ATCC 29581]
MKTCLFKALSVALALMTTAVIANTNYVNFQYPNAIDAATDNTLQSLSSTEYWQVVSGKTLREGINLAFSSEKSVILLSPRALLKQGQPYRAPAIEERAIRLFTQSGEKHLETSYNRDEMTGYGFAPGSAAVQANQLKNQQATLKINQPIGDDDTYLLHVKESHSPYTLAVNAPNIVDAQQGLTLETTIAGIAQSLPQMAMLLRSPQGELVAFEVQQNKIEFKNELTTLGAHQGLYSLELHAEHNVDGLIIKRSIRVPFVHQQSTARLTNQSLESVSKTHLSANIDITVDESGRYGVLASVFGSLNGQYQALATSEAAMDFTHSGELNITFALPPGAKGPYELKVLELKDHTRLQRFAQHFNTHDQ